MSNLLDDIPRDSPDELFANILTRPGLRIERIVSFGQATPEDAPYDQDHDEWVLLLQGAAGLWVEGEGDRTLRPGDHVLIPAHRRHRVLWTAKGSRPSGSPCIWRVRTPALPLYLYHRRAETRPRR